jgi:glycosyltransferase involved in cell wall biosynthesis
MSRMSRLVVINDVSVARGGATALALLEVELFRRLGFAVTCITGDSGENEHWTELGVPVVALGGQRLVAAGLRSSAVRGLYNQSTVSVLSAWIKRNDSPDTIYHLHGWSQILSSSVFRALAPVRVRTLITAHDFFLVCPNGAYANFATGKTCALKPLGLACLTTNCDKRSYTHKLWRAARQGVQSAMLRFTESHPTVLMIHEAMREPLARGGVPDACLRTLPNPVTPWSSERIETENNNSFVFVGRLSEEKGADLAARAARRAGVPLTVIGDGPMLANLRDTYPEVSFAGRLPPEQVAQRVRSARALIMPSRYPEPYGLVAVEALWSGLPVILSKSALLAPDILHRQAGLSFDPLDETELADTMTRLAGDNALAREMSVNAFTNTRDLALSPAAWADGLLSAFEEHLVAPPAAYAGSAKL